MARKDDYLLEAPAFDKAVNDYVALALEGEKENHSSQVESFEAYAAKFREKASHQLHTIKDRFENGYTVLLDEIESQLEPGESIDPYLIMGDKLATINSAEKLTQFYADGNSLYELFEYSPKILTSFYKAAYKILEERRYEEGLNGYFFIVTVAPHMREAWLNLGFAACKLDDYLSGIEAFGNACELDPKKADSYLAACGGWKKLANYDNAYQVCDIGIHYASKHLEETWAQELTQKLESAKNYIQAGG